MPYGNPAGVQAPYFFLSYHRTPSVGPLAQDDQDDDEHVVRLFGDLCRHIRHLTDLGPDIQPGFLDRGTQVGARWSPTLNNALAQCQTFVALYEPMYFRSEFCGYEWASFEKRQAKGRPPGSLAYDAIIPVLMVEEERLPDPLPACARRLQYTDPALPPSYRREGLWGQLYGHEQDYRKTTLVLARKIVAVAQATRIAPCSPEDFDPDDDAFAEETP